MPRKKATQEPEFIPLKPEDIKQSIEISVKTIPIEQIEKIEKLGNIKITKSRKTKEKKSSIKTYTLIITEKPQAALKIAYALSNGNAKKLSESGVPYYEFEREGKKIIVACAVGHLFTLAQDKENGKAKNGSWPVFDVKWQPNYKSKKNDWSKKYYSVLVKLCKDASDFIISTDYDIEGEVIGLNIIRLIAKQQDAKRMKFSTLTSQELENSYNKIMPTLDWGQAIAGETRHYLDWFYGINLSRALMEAIKKAGSFRIFSIGRVQGPALNLVVKKEKEISNFKPETYWQVFILIEGLALKYIKDIKNKKELDSFKELKGKTAILETEKYSQNLPPPAPFDLTTLQTEAYKFFNIAPSRTLQIAQQLYLSGLISYPRTSSQKIPESIKPREIIKKLSGKYETKLCTRIKPVEGSKSDQAHPSIYPTGEFEELEGENEKIYDLIVRRFLSCFCEDALIENKKITATIRDLIFTARGMQIKKENWLKIYKAKMQEKEVPDMSGEKQIEEVKIEEKQTQPPRRYTPASLVRELEKRNLGTKATRSSIIDTLYNRGYIKGQSIEATPLGIKLINSLEKNSPVIIDEALTRKFEKEMDAIQTAKKNLKEKEEKVIQEAKETIIKISQEFKKNEEKIGKELIEATAEMRNNEAEEKKLQTCPKCEKGNLRILFNRANKRYFVACSAYPECKTTFTLPYGLVKRTDKLCESCSWPKLILIKKGRRPWEFCFNPACPGRQKENSSEQ